MAGLKSLAKDTAIYGLSSIVGRFLNYMLVPLYTAVLPASTGGYGVVSNVYAFTALMLVLLTFGMETGFFRFANKSGEDPMKVYANSLLSVGGVSLIFVLLCLLFLQPISNLLDYGDHPEFIAMMAVVVALDSFQCIPFAYLRYKKRPVKFAAIKLLSIIGGIGLNLFFLLVCPWLNVHCPATISWFYDPDYLVGYIFISNLIISVVQMFFFIPELTGFAYKLDRVLLKRMVVYSFPVLILGLVGILNQTVDKMIYPFLFEDRQEGLVQLGIYAATSKIAMVMAMFTQAFRYAYEPFVFGKDREGDNRKMYAAAMKYFLIFSLLAFLAVMFYLDLLRYLVAKGYWEGLGVVAIVMLAEICKGIYFNLSFWYKLTDKTYWGAYFSVIGCVIIVVLNILFVPVYGYLASAWASVAGYAVILLLSYWIGQKEYPIRYDLKSLGLYVLLAAVLYVIGEQVPIPNLVLRLAFRTVLLLLFIAYIIKKDLPLSQIMKTDERNKFAIKSFLGEYLDLKKDKDNELATVDSIRKGVEFKGANLWILIFAIFMASLGLNVNSTAVIIGAMLISPLMGPIMGVGLSVGLNDFELMKRSLKSFLITTAFSVTTATIFFLLAPIAGSQSELLARTSPTIYDVFIALFGGLAGVVALSTKEKGNVIPGVAIATALMPPLCTAGYGLASGNLIYFLGAFYLYFINSVFISLATFLGVRVMHFQRKEFVDKTREKTVRKYIVLIVVLTMCPAVYLTFGIIKSTFYEAAANRFISDQLSFENTQVLDKKISYEHKEVRVVLIGPEVPDASISIARSKMKEYKLEDTKLVVLQGMNNEAVDVTSIRAMVMEDFYKNSEQRLQQQAVKISQLETTLEQYRTYDAMSRTLVPELKVLYPSITTLSIAHSLEVRVDSMKTDTVTLAVLKFDRHPSVTEKQKISEWLKARVGAKKLRLITE